MKVKVSIWAAVLVVLGYFVVAPIRTRSQESQGKANAVAISEQTRQNLLTALRGEAFAYAKYMLYAKRARENGHPELAALFVEAAKTQRFEHFAEEAKLLGLVGSNAENLRGAIKGESYEVDTMYREFAAQAQAAGDREAAERFSEIRQDEMKHRDAYQAALDKLLALLPPAANKSQGRQAGAGKRKPGEPLPDARRRPCDQSHRQEKLSGVQRTCHLKKEGRTNACRPQRQF
jgi:rubrerythrin